MATTFHGPELWAAIQGSIRGGGPRSAAIAFLGNAAPDLLSEFRADDIIVCNAADDTLTSRATSLEALKTLLERGVLLYNVPNLHAKVIVTADVAVVGSANASFNSQQSAEAVIITEQRSVIKDARNFVDQLIADGGTLIDDSFLERARGLVSDKSARRSPNLAGVLGTPPDAGRLFATQDCRVFMEATEPTEYTATVKRVEKQGRRKARLHVPPRSKFEVESWLLYDGAVPYEPNDVLILVQTTGNRVTVYPPRVVVGVARVPGRIPQYVHTLKYRSQDTSRSRRKVLEAFAKVGLRDFEVLDDGTEITARNEIDTLLSVWNLKADD